jgi:hypothetical protein
MLKALILMCICLFTLPTFANELIWSQADHKEIELKLNKNPIYKTQRLGRNQRIERNKLGTAKSPYFKKDNSFYRLFESISKCYKLTIKETVNFYSKTKCPINFTDINIKVNGKIAKRFKTTKLSPKNIQITKTNESYDFVAHKHGFVEIEDMTDLDRHPTELITVSSNEIFNVINLEGSIQIKNEVNLSRTKLGFLSKREEITSQTMKFDQFNKRDFIFKDIEGNFYFYKRYQPAPFTFRFLKTSNSFKDHIQNLERLFYPFNGVNRCFRTSLLGTSIYDCDTLIFKTKSVGSYYKMSLIKVNYKSETYEIIE